MLGAREINDAFADAKSALQRALPAACTPTPPCADVVIVGAGFSGMSLAAAFARTSVNSLCVFEMSASVGGVWWHQANAHSRVNSSEPSYRLRCTRVGFNEDHSPPHELLRDVRVLLEDAHLLERLHLQCRVEKVEPGTKYVVTGTQIDRPFSTTAALVAMCVNRRLGVPRELSWDGERDFVGSICRGLGGDSEALAYAGARTLIVGMGAFALEHVRTALERGGKHAHILCRRRGAVCPKVVDWVNFIRPFDADLSRPAAGDVAVMKLWQRIYDISGATRPECWRDGTLKPDGHTVSVADAFFIAHRYGLASTSLGQVQRVHAQHVVTCAGDTHQCDILVKCVGFEPNRHLESILGRTRMRGNGMVEQNLWVIGEPHLDAAAFKTPFGSSVLNSLDFAALVIVRLFKDAALSQQVATLLPATVSIGGFTSSDQVGALQQVQRAVPPLRDELHTFLRTVAARFQDTLPFAAWVAENRREWDATCALLAARDGARQAEPPLEYIFYPLIDMVHEENGALNSCPVS